MRMKVIDHVRNNRDGQVMEQPWGHNMDEVSVFQAVAAIMKHQQERDKGFKNPALDGRFDTVRITIEFDV